MTKETENKKGKRPRKVKSEEVSLTTPNDGMNTPVRDHSTTHNPSESEKTLYRQAENPLGYPDRE